MIVVPGDPWCSVSEALPLFIVLLHCPCVATPVPAPVVLLPYPTPVPVRDPVPTPDPVFASDKVYTRFSPTAVSSRVPKNQHLV
jgi:hypothetical protein